MNRFDLFKSLKKVIEFSEPYFKDQLYNPFQVLISPLYLQTIQELTLKSIPEPLSNNSPNKLMQSVKWRLKQIKDQFLFAINLKKYKQTKPILFLPVEPTHLLQFFPVWEVLTQKNIPFVVITNRMGVFKKVKIKYPALYIPRAVKILKIEDYKKIVSAQNKVLADCRALCLSEVPLETIYKQLHLHGISVWNLSRQLLKILKKFMPVAVISGYDITYEGRLLTILAKNKQIPTYCIMHGSITGEPLDTMHIVDYFFLFGEAAMEDLVSKGVSAEQLQITGAPYLDKNKNESGEIHPLLRKRLSLTPSKPYFFIAMSGPGHSTSYAHFQLILQNLFAVAAKHPEAQWVIKMHRKDKIENYKDIIEQNKNHQIFIIEHDTPGFPKSIFEWLQGATALLTGTSTVAIEAMSIGVPVITMDFMEEYQMVDFIDLGATIHVKDKGQLENTIDRILKDPETFEEITKCAAIYASRYFFKSEKTAAENIVDFVISK